MRFSSSSVLAVAVFASVAFAVPVARDPTLQALEREVASLVPALRSGNPSSQYPSAAALVTVLEQAASDLSSDINAVAPDVASLVGEMSVAVHEALGDHAAPLVESIDNALERLMQITSVRGHPSADTVSPQQLVLNTAA